MAFLSSLAWDEEEIKTWGSLKQMRGARIVGIPFKVWLAIINVVTKSNDQSTVRV